MRRGHSCLRLRFHQVPPTPTTLQARSQSQSKQTCGKFGHLSQVINCRTVLRFALDHSHESFTASIDYRLNWPSRHPAPYSNAMALRHPPIDHKMPLKELTRQIDTLDLSVPKDPYYDKADSDRIKEPTVIVII